MKVVVSKLFSLNFALDWVANAHVGDGVYIQEIKLGGWLADFCKKLQSVSEEFYQDLEGSLRKLFSKAFESRTFADEPADATVLEAIYPV